MVKLSKKALFLFIVFLLFSSVFCMCITAFAETEEPLYSITQDAQADAVVEEKAEELDVEPESVNGWRTEGKHKLYYVDNVPLKYLQTIDGKSYYFNSSGYMLTGLITFKDGIRYFATNGVMQTGWQKVNNKYYYFKKTGFAALYSQKLNGNTYYFNSKGEMVTGFLKFSKTGKTCYYNANGAMVTGWRYIGGKWYYFKSDGAMALYTNNIDGKTYYFNSKGVMHIGWLKYKNGEWRYFNTSGAMVKNDWIGYQYYVNGSGNWVPGKAMPINIALGVKKSSVISWMTSHEKDKYYLTTPYAGRKATGSSSSIYGWNPTGCIRPNGRYSGNNPGLNCAGFVADVFAYSGAGWSNVEKIGTVSRSYISATAWYNYVQNNKLKYYWFDSIDAALQSGKLHKGDVIYFQPKSSSKDAYGNPSETHMGFFWGNTSNENRLWHSSWNVAKGLPGAGTLTNGNQISVLSPLCVSSVYVFPLE